MVRARRGAVVVVVCAGLLGLPAPGPAAAADTGSTAVFADDPQRGALTYDEATGATVTATLTSAMNAFTVEAAQGDATHKVTVTTTVPLGAGTFQTGSQVTVATDTCWHLSSGTLTITELAKDDAGALTALAASYDGWCGTQRWLGTVRYRSAQPWSGVHAPRPAFPATLTGQSSSRDVTVTATGTAPVTLAALTGVTQPFAVAADGCSGVTLAAGESCAVTVSFTPTSARWYSATLTLPADGARGSVKVGLNARGVVPPLAPTSLRAVGGYDGVGLSWWPPPSSSAYPAPTAYRVYRDGAAEPIATVTTTHYADLAAPGETHSYTVSAVAGDAGEGAKTAAASATVPTAVTETTGDVTGMAVETWSGGYATTDVTLPDPVAGRVTLTSGDRLVTLTPQPGSAWAPGTISAAVTGNNCFPNVIELTVHEAKVRADGTPVTLAASSTYPCNEGSGYLEVRYAARTPLVAGDTTPDVVEAPVTKPGLTSATTTVTVANGGSEPLDLGAAAAPAAWPVSDDTCSGTSVAVGGSCTLVVTFAPTSTGVHDGTLTIPDNTPRGRREVRLAGMSSALPSAVRNLTATPLAGRVVLRYDPPEHAHPPIDNYVVSRARAADGPYTTLTGGWNRALSYVDEQAVPGRRFYYKVRAVNAYGSGPAATATAVTVGKEIVYTADTGSGTYHLTGRGLPRGAATRLTTGAKDEEDPSFSPGGALAFTREDIPGRFHVYLSRGDGTNPRRQAGDVDGVAWTYRNPRLSSDAKRLAFACRPLTQTWWDLCVRSQTSGFVKKVPGVLPSGGSWLANSNELVVVSATSPPTIQVVAYDNSYRVAIPGTANARQVTLSPDGSRIAWTRYEGEEDAPDIGGPRYSLRVSPLSGGAGVALTSTGYSNDPSWSPDSGTVYFTHLTRAPGSPGTRDVYSARATGGALTRLTDTPGVDEDHVAFRDVVTPGPSPLAARPMADFTGDGKAEIAVWRPGTGQWRIRGQRAVVWGRLGDIPVAADYNGDRKADRAVFRPSTGTWHVYGRSAVKYGRPGDVPVPADYNGDGKTDFAVFRPSTGTWYVYGRAPVAYGAHGQIPAPADYDGDRKADIAVFHPEWGTFHVRGRYGDWGQEGGVPVPADYLGLGRAQRAVFHGRSWSVDETYGGPIATVPRTLHDVPAYGNFNGDRRAEPGVFNPTLGAWRVLGQSTVVWGIPGDIPV